MPTPDDDDLVVYSSDDPDVLGLFLVVDRGDHAEIVARSNRIEADTFAEMLEQAATQIRAHIEQEKAKFN